MFCGFCEKSNGFFQINQKQILKHNILITCTIRFIFSGYKMPHAVIVSRIEHGEEKKKLENFN